ncbi:MAG: hypothetical protein HIU92_06350 [Proteobacteria bacterium]|nr:hypothetical protein [Pseudomonadota bacterium]
MRDDSQSTFPTDSGTGSTGSGPWHPCWTGLVEKKAGLTDETLSALLLLILSGAEDHQSSAPASERVVNILSEMEAHPAGSPGENAVRAQLVSRLSAALSGLRAELD